MYSMKATYFLTLSALLVSACQTHTCTLMGCVEGVTLEFATPLEEEGEYTFTVTTEATTATCVAFVPLRRDGTEPNCPSFSIHREEITTRDDDAVSGRAGDKIVSVSIGGEYETLTIEITRDGTAVLQEDVMPVYEGVEINGEGCGECLMATHTVGG